MNLREKRTDESDSFDDAELEKLIHSLRNNFNNGSGKAGFSLGSLLSPFGILTEKQKGIFAVSIEKQDEIYRSSFDYLLKEANLGDGESMHIVSLYYQIGLPPVEGNFDSFFLWAKKSFYAGYTHAGNELYSIYSDVQSKFFDPERAKEVLYALEKNNMRFVE